MKKNRAITIAILYVFILAGCATTVVYEESDKNQIYSKVIFQASKGINKFFDPAAVYPIKINGLTLTSWKLSDKFLIQPGVNTFYVSVHTPKRNTTAFCEIRFEAAAGETYIFKREVEIENIRFFVERSDGKIIFEKRVQKIPTYIQYPN